MTWGQDHEPEAVQEREMTELVPEPERTVRAETIALATDSITVGEAELESTIGWSLMFSYPGTWSVEEQRDALSAIIAQFRDSSTAKRAFYQCLSIMGSLPDDVVPKVLAQLQEIAEYEAWIWRKQHEPLGAPNIWDRRVRLPVER